MADVFLTEDYEDAAEDSNQDTMDDLSGSLKENSDMSSKQENELFTADDLLVNPDDLLPPVVKLEKYANSDIVFNRQVVARNLLETLRLVHENSDDVARVINVLGSISDDYDSSVRTELMVQLPHIAAFCHEVKLNNIIVQYLVPMLLSYLRDENNVVRKFSHSALLSMLEQGLIDSTTQSEKVWPLVLHMTDSINPEDIRIEAILLTSKLVVLIGAEEQFFDRLFALCMDRCNNIRKACASIFGDICTSLGREVTEEILLPKFFALCEDNAWCVRKACAENFMPVSCVVSREIRCKELSSLYMILLSDQSRWVRVTAYQALGPFISTFAEPDKTGLYYSKDGVLTIVDNPPPAFPSSPDKNVSSDEHSCCNGDANNQSKASSDVQNNCNFDRTASEPCDNIVPLSCVTTPSTEVPSISCKVGNLCTVIEVNPPDLTIDSKDKSQVDEVDEKAGKESSPPESEPLLCNSDSGSVELTDSEISVTQNKTEKLNNEITNHVSKEEFFKMWDEAIYGCDDFTSEVMNGEVDIVNNKVLGDIAQDGKSVFHNIITVNGVNYGLNLDKKSLINSLNSRKTTLNSTNHRKSLNLKQCILNKLSKGTEDLSNLNSHSMNCSGDEESMSTDVSSTVNIPSQESNCTDSEILNTESDEDVLKPTSDKPLDQESAFNSFQYWREPIPPIELEDELSFLFDNTSCVPLRNPDRQDSSRKLYFPGNTKKSRSFSSYAWCKMKSSSRDMLEKNNPQLREQIQFNEIPDNKGEPPPKMQYTVHDQDIVPPELLLQYLSMIDSTWAQTIDAEIARHCAYSLPAVALTLGRKYWPCLKDTFDALTSDLQGFIMMWKVRRTVASAMHQLAVILGPEITSKDLLPVFSRFISDLDEVRIGVLQHLYDFLKLLRPEERVQFLPSLPQFLISNSDVDINEKNWRFRLILAEQLVCIADLYEPQHVRDHLVPLSLTLIKDKVCEVRLAAVRVMAAVMRRMSQSPTQVLTKAVLNELTEKFVHSPKWLYRQLYVYICQEFIVENSLTADQFSEDALPQLLYLCWDRVPNVRLAIARCLVTVIWPLDTFSNPDSPHRGLLLETIHTLQSDLDADVRSYANMVSTHECSCLQNGEYSNADLTSGESFA